tara:strand:+ start:28 stop:576 length:549 start_codon:yes stop_codon:yes gene_type:complete
MANTTFQGNVRAEGGLEQATKNATTGAYTTNFDVDTSGSMIYRNRVTDLATATYTVAATESGTVFSLNKADGVVVTLPAAASGLNYTFIVGTTATSNKYGIDCAGSDLYSGFATLFDPATATDTNTFISGNTSCIDLGSAEQGWLVGGIVRLVAVLVGSTTVYKWHCEAHLHGDGTLATPFE